MTIRTVTLEDLKKRPLEDIFQEVLDREEILTVRLPGGKDVRIQPTEKLKPLPVLKGTVLEGWKDAIHE